MKNSNIEWALLWAKKRGFGLYFGPKKAQPPPLKTNGSALKLRVSGETHGKLNVHHIMYIQRSRSVMCTIYVHYTYILHSEISMHRREKTFTFYVIEIHVQVGGGLVIIFEQANSISHCEIRVKSTYVSLKRVRRQRLFNSQLLGAQK